MKKTILMITMLVAIIVSASFIVSADDGYYIDTEGVELTLDEIVSINEITDDSAHVALDTLYNVNTIQLDLSGVWDKFNFYDTYSESINSIYLYINIEFPFGKSADGDWTYSDENLVTISDERLRYSYNNVDDITLEIAYTGYATLMALENIEMYIEYSVPINPVVDVVTDYNSLPDNKNYYEYIESYELYDVASNSYHIMFDKYDSTINKEIGYQFDVSLPEDINLDDYVMDSGAINVTYSTLENGDRVLYMQSDLSLPAKPLSAYSYNGFDDEDFARLQGFTVINLTQQETQNFKMLQLDSIINKEDNYNAFMYCFYDITIEDILLMSVEYDYRYNTLGIAGSWNTAYNTYTYDTSTMTNVPWWFIYVMPFKYPEASILDMDSMEDIFLIDTISSITQAEVPEDVLDTYYESFNKTSADLTDMNLYKVHIGQFTQDSIFSGFNTGYDITEFSVTKLIYRYQGVIYSASERQLEEQENVLPEISNVWDDIVSDFPVITVDGYDIGLLSGVLVSTGLIVLIVFIVKKYKKYKRMFNNK